MFTEPTFELPKPELSPDLVQMVNDSVARFTEKLGMFKHAPQAAQWIEDYKTEVASIAMSAFEMGKVK